MVEPVEDQKNDSEEQPTPTPIRVPAETLRTIALATAGLSAVMLVGSVLAYFLLDAFRTAVLLAGIALIDPVIMQFVLSRLRAPGINLSDVDLDSPFERYFYEKELEQAKNQQIGQLTGPIIGASVLLMVAGNIMDSFDLSAKVLPLFALWAGTAFMLALYAGSMLSPAEGD